MKILLATDGSKHSQEAALRSCDFLMADKDSRIKIVSVVDSSQPAYPTHFGVSNDFYLTLNSQLTKAAKEFVADAEKIVREKVGDNIEIETDILNGSPKAAVVEEAENWGADLIVVGSHGYGFFERMLIGSVSDGILHHAPCSVLVVKIDAGEEGTQ
ncbi:MAG: universal stress protein [Pyrinomonadaceae bacterium]|nr:universal stress protein [Pyrinomonadaceae bacterium]